MVRLITTTRSLISLSSSCLKFVWNGTSSIKLIPHRSFSLHADGKKDNKGLESHLFTNVLSDENMQRVAHRLERVKPVRTEKHVPLKPDHQVAAVLVPLCVVDNQPSILLTLRSSQLAKYRGQVSFPGGNVDADDPNVEFTALRETQEELGIDPSTFKIWGQMSGLPASSDGNGKMVHPILATMGNLDLSTLTPSPHEVEEAFTVPIRDLCNPTNIGSTRFRSIKGRSYTLPVYTTQPHRIWGFTAIVVHMLLSILTPDLYHYKLKHKQDVTR